MAVTLKLRDGENLSQCCAITTYFSRQMYYSLICAWGMSAMCILRNLAVALCLIVLVACAIHPLPEDVTGVSTYDIVRQIRCEARKAIIDSTIGWLTNDPKVDSESKQIGSEFANNLRRIDTLNPKLFKGRVRRIMTVFYDTGIAYNFNLQMTENNNIDPTINLLKPFKNGGVFTMGVSGVADRQRQNTRIFTVTDKFSDLIQNVPDDYCTNYIVRENYIYPIAGKVGIEKVIQDFIRLTLFGSLGGPPGKEAGPPTMVDTLEFITTFSLTATPKAVFTPIGNALQVLDASLIASVTRKDVHKVTVGLAIAGAVVSEVGPLRSTLFGPLLTASGGRSEQAAAAAVNQALTLQIFQPTVVVSP